jgi:hypothetical protein
MSWKWSTKTKTLVRFIASKIFKLGVDDNIVVVLEEDGTRVTDDGFLLLLESHTKLMILRNNTHWTQQPGNIGRSTSTDWHTEWLVEINTEPLKKSLPKYSFEFYCVMFEF